MDINEVVIHNSAVVKRTNLNGGDQFLVRFPNGYGASIISSAYSYGVELAVIAWDGEDFKLTYDTPITDDVIGHNTPESLAEYLDQIRELPPLPREVEK